MTAREAPWWLSKSTAASSHQVCTQCGRVLEAERMMRVEITRAGESEALTRWLCPPHASAFGRAWLEIGLEALR